MCWIRKRPRCNEGLSAKLSLLMDRSPPRGEGREGDRRERKEDFGKGRLREVPDAVSVDLAGEVLLGDGAGRKKERDEGEELKLPLVDKGIETSRLGRRFSPLSRWTEFRDVLLNISSQIPFPCLRKKRRERRETEM